jgi:hypothetical protein
MKIAPLADVRTGFSDARCWPTRQSFKESCGQLSRRGHIHGDFACCKQSPLRFIIKFGLDAALTRYTLRGKYRR